MCAALRRSLVDAVTMSCRTRWARHAYLARHVIQRRSRQELPLFEPRSSTFGTYIHKLRSFPLQFSIECTLSVSHLYSRGSPSRLPVVAWRPRVQLSPPRATYYAWLLGATAQQLQGGRRCIRTVASPQRRAREQVPRPNLLYSVNSAPMHLKLGMHVALRLGYK